MVVNPIKLLIILVTFIIFLSGCNMNNPILKDIETAYKLPAQSHAERNKNITDMVKKRFRSDMDVSEVLKELQNYGFTITENRNDGWKSWPDGKIVPYFEDERKKYFIPQKGLMKYVAKKNYHTNPLETKRAFINIESDGKKIINFRVDLYSDTL